MSGAARGLARSLLRILLLGVAVGVVAVAAGVAYAAVRAQGLRSSIVSALLIFGGAIVAWTALTGGGAHGRRADALWWGESPPPTLPFTDVLVGLVVVGLGVLAIYV